MKYQWDPSDPDLFEESHRLAEFPLGSSILLTSLVVNPHSLAILCLDEHELGEGN